MSLTIKFSLFTSFLCLSVILGITYLSYRISYRELEQSLGEKLESIVRTGAASIDGDLHDRVRGPEDVEGEAFTTLRQQLRDIKRANELETEVYTFRQEGESLKFVVMTNEKPFVGDTYGIRPEMRVTLTKGQPNHTLLYEDSHGQWISAYAPILDSQGNISGLLEADYEVHTFFSLLREKFIYLMIKALAFALAAVAVSYLLALSVTRKLVYLTDITEKISLGKMDKPIQIEGRDEVARLGESLERMRESLVIAAKLID
ncbi:Cache and HAMP domain-containing protein [Sulfidibacter corallicola]|uniref:Cache and HAMP domain-containing protein n=1 Tax=Sulfidibacter corallicola TaxID=2818388 RepID=A0A8A4TSE1_SULCO|nr:HAMP domain-containing protein [Sulfidibacter corallicola]QTD52307.1 cache and HAMP domain-containing protein [Sulfidibacter corallicola]